MQQAAGFPQPVALKLYVFPLVCFSAFRGNPVKVFPALPNGSALSGTSHIGGGMPFHPFSLQPSPLSALVRYNLR